MARASWVAFQQQLDNQVIAFVQTTRIELTQGRLTLAVVYKQLSGGSNFEN